MKTLHKVAVAAAATLAMGTVAFAATTLTGSVTGGTINTNAVWDGSIPGFATGSATVGVSANVAPTLTMALSKNALSLGQLNTDGTTYSDDSLTITGSTNATSGMAITMGSAGLAYNGKYIGNGTGFTAGSATADSTDQYKYSTTGVAGSGSVDINASANAVYSTGKPVVPTATTVSIGAVAGATTEAGSYGDTLTFTVTGNF